MTDEEEEYVDQAMAKPVFVRSSDRITVKEREKLAEEEKVPLTPPVHRRQPPEGTYLAYTRGGGIIWVAWRGGPGHNTGNCAKFVVTQVRCIMIFSGPNLFKLVLQKSFEHLNFADWGCGTGSYGRRKPAPKVHECFPGVAFL